MAVGLAVATCLLPAAPARAYATAMATAAAPTLLSPIDGATVSSAPVLRWLGGVNARSYGVKVWPSGNPAAPVCNSGGPFTWSRCEDIPPGTYEWSVQSFDLAQHPGGVSAVGRFTRSTPAIAAPALLTPSNDAVLDYPDSVGALRWAPAPGAELYQFQVSTSPTFDGGAPDLLYSFAILSSEVPREHIGVKQYWRVRGVNASRTWAGPWSPTRSFTATWSDVPTLLLPADGGSASNIFLQWSPVKGASRYEIEVTAITDTDFSDAILTWEEATSTGWGAIPAGDLRWRVRARNDHGGVTAWSTSRSIHRDASAPAAVEPEPVPPPDVTLASPADGATFPSTAAEVPLTWTPVAGALKYELDVRIAGGDWWHLNHTVGAGPIRWRFDPGVTYEWRIRSVGENEVRGAWSDVRELSISDPASVALLSPADGATLPASAQIVSWQAVPGSFNYRVEIDDDPDFDGWQDHGAYRNPVTSASLGAHAPGRWYWRVRAGLEGTDALSDVRAVDVVDDIAPAGSVGFLVPSTMETAAHLNLAAQDGFGEVVEAQVSADGTTWESFAMPAWGHTQVAWSLTSVAHGGATPGQRNVHARYRDEAGNWSETLSASIWYGMERPLDETPPTGTITIENGAAFTSTRLPVIDIPATDINGVTAIALSTDGATWVERPHWPEQQVTVSSGSGPKTVFVKWKDGLGNWSAAKSDSIILTVGGADETDPTTTKPTNAFAPGAAKSVGKVPVRFTWTGSDAGSGVARYEAAISKDGGSWSTVSTSLTSAATTRLLAPGHSYRLRVRAIDNAGNVRAWVAGSTFTLKAYQDASSSIKRVGTWTVSSNANFWGGTERRASDADASAKLTFTGRSFAWIGSTGPTRGSAKVYVDGTLVQTVSLQSSATSYRRVLVQLSWGASASRTIKVVVVGTAGHPRVNIDAFVTGT
jgi:hypothetical protein